MLALIQGWLKRVEVNLDGTSVSRIRWSSDVICIHRVSTSVEMEFSSTKCLPKDRISDLMRPGSALPPSFFERV